MKTLVLLFIFSSFVYSKTLILIGGGKRPKEALRVFVQRSIPNSKIFILPWGTSYPNDSYNKIKSELVSVGGNQKNIICLCSDEIKPSEITELKRAGGIYFPGGNQNKVMARIKKYNLKPLFKTLYNSDIPIAGTSAGTAIQTQIMLTGDGSKTAEGLGLLKGFIVDQHFHKRDREARLIGALEKHSELYGLGVDEDMSVIISGDKYFHAIGPSIFSIYLPKDNDHKRIDFNNGSTYTYDN